MRLGKRGTPMDVDDAHSLAFHLKGRSQGDQDMYVMINSYWESLTFVVQATASGTWARVIDTGSESPIDFLEPGAEAVLTSTAYSVGPRSIVVLLDISLLSAPH